MIQKINFYGQLGNNTNISKVDVLFIKLLENHKNLYDKFEKRYHKMQEIELTRIFQDIQFKAVVLYGEIDYKKIYQLSEMKCKKILYIENIPMFNTSVKKKIYQNLDQILVTNQTTYDFVKKYCEQDTNIKLINPINDLTEFNQFIG